MIASNKLQTFRIISMLEQQQKQPTLAVQEVDPTTTHPAIQHNAQCVPSVESSVVSSVESAVVSVVSVLLPKPTPLAELLEEAPPQPASAMDIAKGSASCRVIFVSDMSLALIFIIIYMFGGIKCGINFSTEVDQ